MKDISIFNQLRPVTVGFDSVFDNFERMFSDDFFGTPSSYPAYNIVRTKDNHYDVEVALAGFNKKDILRKDLVLQTTAKLKGQS